MIATLGLRRRRFCLAKRRGYSLASRAGQRSSLDGRGEPAKEGTACRAWDETTSANTRMMPPSHGRDETADAHATAPAHGRARKRFAPALLALSTSLVIAAAPSAALAASSEGPLLSGYGGPGAGEQVILGSGFSHSRPNRGGGEQGAPETSSGAGESGSQAASPQGSSAAPNHASTTREGGGEASGPRTPARGHTGHGSGGTPASGSPVRGGTQTAVVAAEPLGLSGGDIALVIVVACALVSLGVLTRFAARGER